MSNTKSATIKNISACNIMTTCVVQNGSDRAIAGVISKELLDKLYSVYDEIEKEVTKNE